MEKFKVPKNEQVLIRYYVKDTLRFVMTTKVYNRDYYYLYEFVDGQLKKLGKAHTPPELEDKYDVNNKIKLTK